MSEAEQGAGTSDKNPGIVLLPKRVSCSRVWAFFGFKPDDTTPQTIYYKQCLAIVSAPTSNATNLQNHLKRHHILQYDEMGLGGGILDHKVPARSQNKRQLKQHYSKQHHTYQPFQGTKK